MVFCNAIPCPSKVDLSLSSRKHIKCQCGSLVTRAEFTSGQWSSCCKSGRRRLDLYIWLSSIQIFPIKPKVIAPVQVCWSHYFVSERPCSSASPFFRTCARWTSCRISSFLDMKSVLRIVLVLQITSHHKLVLLVIYILLCCLVRRSRDSRLQRRPN